MTRDQATRIACGIVGLAYVSKADYTNPNDGFCSACPAALYSTWDFKNCGEALRYVLAAVQDKLTADGVAVREDLVALINSMFEEHPQV